jgi:hypothetical protein
MSFGIGEEILFRALMQAAIARASLAKVRQVHYDIAELRRAPIEGHSSW